MYSSFTNTGLLKNRAGKADPCQKKTQVLITMCHLRLGRESFVFDMVHIGVISCK